MNWGKGIIIFLCAFMLFIVAMGIAMFRQPDDIDEHYYEKGLAFDVDYNKEKQVINDKAQPVVSFNHDTLQVRFTAPAKGILNFLRPANAKIDSQFKLQSDTNNEVKIPISAIRQGRWQLVFNWESHGKTYLFTKEIFIP